MWTVVYWGGLGQASGKGFIAKTPKAAHSSYVITFNQRHFKASF